MNRFYLYSSCISAVIADMLFVWYAKNVNHPMWSFIIALIINLLGVLVWTYSMRKGIEAANAITIYALFTVAGCTALGYYVFNEKLSMLNIIGLILSIVSIYLISR